MSKFEKNCLILVDGSSYLYRAYYAYPPLINSIGEPTGAIYGVLNMLKSLLIKYNPTTMAVIFDAKGKTFRDELFKDYKAHREPMPEKLRCQTTPLYEMIKAMGIPLLVVEGVESDDVIGTLALSAVRNGQNVLISTGDKDMAQLVSSNITLINTMSGIVLDPEEIKKKFGVPPKLIIDYLALMGDKSDNIPGIPGVGKIIAQTLLKKLGSLKVIYQQLDKIEHLNFRGAKTMAIKLKQHQKTVLLSYQLATIKTDVTLDLPYDYLIIKQPIINVLIQFFQRYEFKRWLSDVTSNTWIRSTRQCAVNSPLILTTDNSITDDRTITSSLQTKCQIIYDLVILNTWINTLRQAGQFVFNIQTDGLNILTTNLIGLSFSIKSGIISYLPFKKNLDTSKYLDCTVVLDMLKPILEDSSILKIGHNCKFNHRILKRHNIELKGISFDIVLESYVLDNFTHSYNIRNLIKRYLLRNKTMNFKDEDHIKHQKCAVDTQISMGNCIAIHISETNMTLKLHQQLWSQIEYFPDLKKVFQEIDMPLIPVLSRIEHAGVLIDKNILTTHSSELTIRLKTLKNQAYQLANESFNLSSTKELQKILFDKYKMPILKKTLGGVPSTDEEVLTKLASSYPLAKIILEYRRLYKLKFTYVDKLSKMINVRSKRIHTSYHQIMTATGRLSSCNPNLQNIPIRDSEGRRIRQAFIAPPGMLIMSADYSQIELRIMAHFSRDLGLLHAFSIGKDIHCATAVKIFGVPLEQVTYEQRRKAKIINFGLMYGISIFGLARQLSISHLQAKNYIESYFQSYPGVLKYVEHTKKLARDQSYVSTLDGRRFYLSDMYVDRNGTRKKNVERVAINASIQGTAADIIKRAMISIDHWIQNEAPPVRMIMQVHDELVFEVQNDAIQYIQTRIKELMEGCYTLNVPLQVMVNIGNSWAKVH
ncbi:DNA polymerase I [Candidatus Curculioniphilus buchneri]|uniref:DNA polymerase I n=1 Tax=Candidatus Curculioniphilus buchneri TaxID=690594 RepID=UPI00376F4456